eukprot:gb/GECG01011657.1/.p1 GENE.gb/GECG01011657.1/~~gb/GECG01011657.1/.p1  ORF type:complete len:1497 (+),score=217.60 gb/GECG01011657.1/:1-4491(+)
MDYSGPEEDTAVSHDHRKADMDSSVVQESDATQQEPAPHVQTSEYDVDNGPDSGRSHEQRESGNSREGDSPRGNFAASSEGGGKGGSSSQLKRTQPSSASTARSISRATRDHSQIDRLCQMFIDEHSEDLIQRQIDSLISFLQNNENGYDIRTIDGLADLIPLVAESVDRRTHREFPPLLAQIIALCQKPIRTDFSSESTSQDQTLSKFLRSLKDLLYSRSECVRVAAMETLSWFAASDEIYKAWLGEGSHRKLDSRDLSLREHIRKLIPRCGILADVIHQFQQQIDELTLPPSTGDDDDQGGKEQKRETTNGSEGLTSRIDVLADSLGSTAGLNTPIVRNTSLMQGINLPYFLEVIVRFLEWTSEYPLSSKVLIKNGICGSVVTLLDYLASTRLEYRILPHICGLLWNVCEHSLRRFSSSEVVLSLASLLRKHRFHNACYLLSKTPVFLILNQLLEKVVQTTRKADDKSIRNDLTIIVTLVCKSPSPPPTESGNGPQNMDPYGGDRVLADLVESFASDFQDNDKFHNGGALCLKSGLLNTVLVYGCACEMGLQTEGSYRWFGTSDEADLEFKQLLWDLVLVCVNAETEAYRWVHEAEKELERYRSVTRTSDSMTHQQDGELGFASTADFSWPVLREVKHSSFIQTLLAYLDPLQESHPYLATWSPAQRRTLELQSLSILTQLAPLCLPEFGEAGGIEVLTLYLRKHCSFLSVNQLQGRKPAAENSVLELLREYGLLDLYQSHCRVSVEDDDEDEPVHNSCSEGEHDNDRFYLALKLVAAVAGFNVGITGMGTSLPWNRNSGRTPLVQTSPEASARKYLDSFSSSNKESDKTSKEGELLNPQWAPVDYSEEFGHFGCPEDIVYTLAMLSFDAQSAVSTQGHASALELSTTQSMTQMGGAIGIENQTSNISQTQGSKQTLGIVASMGGASTPVGHVVEMALIAISGLCQARNVPEPELRGTESNSVAEEAAAAVEASKSMEIELEARARNNRLRLLNCGATEILLVWLRCYMKQQMKQHYHDISDEVNGPTPPEHSKQSQTSMKAHVLGAKMKGGERPPAGRPRLKRVFTNTAAAAGEAGDASGFPRVGAAILSAIWALCTELEAIEIFVRGDGIPMLLDLLEICPHEEKGQILGFLADLTSVNRESDKWQWQNKGEREVISLVSGDHMSRESISNSIRSFIQGWRSSVSGNNALYVLCRIWANEEDRLGIKRGQFGEILQFIRPLDGRETDDEHEEVASANGAPSFASQSTLVPKLSSRNRPHLSNHSIEGEMSVGEGSRSSAFDRLKDALRAAKMWQQLEGREPKRSVQKSKCISSVEEEVRKSMDLRPKLFCLFDAFGFEEIYEGQMGPFEKVAKYPRLQNVLALAEYFQELLIYAMWDDVRRSLSGEPVEGWEERDKAAAVVGVTSDRQPVKPIGADAAILASRLEDGTLTAMSVKRKQEDIIAATRNAQSRDEQEEMQKVLNRRAADERNAKLAAATKRRRSSKEKTLMKNA